MSMDDRIPWHKPPPRPPESRARTRRPYHANTRSSSSTVSPLLFYFLLAYLSAIHVVLGQHDVSSTISTFPTLQPVNISHWSSSAIRIQPDGSNRLLFLTINICTPPSDDDDTIDMTSNPPRIFLSNSSSVQFPTTDAGGSSLKRDTASTGQSWSFSTKSIVSNSRVKGQPDGGVWSVVVNQGFANWTGFAEDGLWINVTNVYDGVAMEIGVSYDAPIHAIYQLKPLLGDTTSTQSLLFSPILSPLDITPPSYPNYTLSSPLPIKLPPPNSSIGGGDQNIDVVIVPTTHSPALVGLSNSMCAMRRAYEVTTAGSDGQGSTERTETRTNGTTVVQRPEGWRRSFLTSGLVDGTNYTAWLVDARGQLDRGSMWGPIMMRTKKADFPCRLAHQLDLCPSIAYAAAINGDPSQPVTSLPDDLETTLTNSLNGFSTSLLTTACGRDLYSPVSSCYDCFNEYREWLCRVIIPQCADDTTIATTTTTTTTTTTITTTTNTTSGNDSIPPKTIRRTPDNPRTNLTSTPSYAYTELLPCMAMCRRADRACPAFLGFRCPSRGVTANSSYAVVVADDKDKVSDGQGEGEEDGGVDQWGNRWCNGYELPDGWI